MVLDRVRDRVRLPDSEQMAMELITPRGTPIRLLRESERRGRKWNKPADDNRDNGHRGVDMADRGSPGGIVTTKLGSGKRSWDKLI